MSTLTELTLQLKDVLSQIRMADPYESARLSKQVANLTTQIRREKVLAHNRSHLVVKQTKPVTERAWQTNPESEEVSRRHNP